MQKEEEEVVNIVLAPEEEEVYDFGSFKFNYEEPHKPMAGLRVGDDKLAKGDFDLQKIPVAVQPVRTDRLSLQGFTDPNLTTFSLQDLKLEDNVSAGRFFVWQMNKNELPLACKAESYFDRNMFWGIFYKYKGALYSNEYDAIEREALIQDLGPDRGEKESDKRIEARKLAGEEFNKRLLHSASFKAMNMYAKAMLKTVFDVRYSQPQFSLFEKLKAMSLKQEGSQSSLENMANILRYLTEFNIESVSQKLSHKVKNGVNKNYLAAMVTRRERLPLYWFLFTLRTVKGETCLILWAIAKSLLYFALASYEKLYEGHEFKLKGPFCLSMLLHVAASLNNGVHVKRIYLEALTGTEKMISSMRAITKTDSPFLQRAKPKLAPDKYFVDALRELPDKIIVDEQLLNYWQHNIDKREKVSTLEEAKEAMEKRRKLWNKVTKLNPKFQ